MTPMRSAWTVLLFSILVACKRESESSASSSLESGAPVTSTSRTSGDLQLPPEVIAHPHDDASGLTFASPHDAGAATMPTGHVEIVAIPTKDATLTRELTKCYDQGLQSDPYQAGVVTWSVTWSSDAWVTTRTSKSLLAPVTEECMAKAVRAYAAQRPSKASFELTVRCSSP